MVKFYNPYLKTSRFFSRFPGREALLVESVAQPDRNGEVVERRTHRRRPKRVFGTVDTVVGVFVAVAHDVRKSEVVAGADIDLETPDQQRDTAAARKSVAPTVVARQFEGVVALPVGRSRSFRPLVLIGRREVIGESRRRFEVDADMVAEEVEVGLPHDRQHDRIDVARVVAVILLLLDHRGVGGQRESLLQEFEVDAEAAHEKLLSVIAPRKPGGVGTPYSLHLLLGVEPRAGHAVTCREAERMLRRRALPRNGGKGEKQQGFKLSLYHNTIG